MLVGYADRFSVRPGERIAFMVSCEPASEFRADIVRLVHGDTNPAGPGFKEELVETAAGGDYPARRQEIYAGSHAEVPDHPLLRELTSFALSCYIWPTTPAKGVQGLLTKWDPESSSGYGLFVNESGAIELWLGDGERVQHVSTGRGDPWSSCRPFPDRGAPALQREDRPAAGQPGRSLGLPRLDHAGRSRYGRGAGRVRQRTPRADGEPARACDDRLQLAFRRRLLHAGAGPVRGDSLPRRRPRGRRLGGGLRPRRRPRNEQRRVRGPPPCRRRRGLRPVRDPPGARVPHRADRAGPADGELPRLREQPQRLRRAARSAHHRSCAGPRTLGPLPRRASRAWTLVLRLAFGRQRRVLFLAAAADPLRAAEGGRRPVALGLAVQRRPPPRRLAHGEGRCSTPTTPMWRRAGGSCTWAATASTG